jgi:hypothetical protein
MNLRLKILIALAVLFLGSMFIILMPCIAAAQQTNFYDSSGRHVGTAAPQGQGSVRYYDSRGSSLGTSTTTGNTTTFYGPGGSVTGRATGPSGNRPFGGARR